ncbi:serine hydrolase [Luedemannella helvata]|uniref:Beta-lactamase class A catalytic domain-containing protein n=1 Tax=Luedemannella helvata TaxID=349315 RepID=A0ABN2L0H2_9ACTN
MSHHASPVTARRLRLVLALVALVTAGLALRFVPGSPLAPASAAEVTPTPPVSDAAAASTPAEKTTPQKTSPKKATPKKATPEKTTAKKTSPRKASKPTPTTVRVGTDGFWSWALLDRTTGRIVGSANIAAQSTTASMIKAWLASDYLRMAAARGVTPSESTLHDLEIMIRDSDNAAAAKIFAANGRTASIQRLISVCGLTDSTVVPNEWGTTRVSARDAVRMGNCIATGKAAGARWTPWVLNMMREVRGDGDFGIRDALPAATAARVAIKNGWLLRDEDNHWHVSCLAIGDTWVMSVLQRYPSTGDAESDFAHTRDVCERVADQVLPSTGG